MNCARDLPKIAMCKFLVEKPALEIRCEGVNAPDQLTRLINADWLLPVSKRGVAGVLPAGGEISALRG